MSGRKFDLWYFSRLAVLGKREWIVSRSLRQIFPVFGKALACIIYMASFVHIIINICSEINLNDLAETKTRNTYCTVSKFPQKYTAEKQPCNAQTPIPERIRSR